MAKKMLFLWFVYAISVNAFADTVVGDAHGNSWYISASAGITDIEYAYPNRSDFKAQASVYGLGAGINVFTHFSVELNYYDLAVAHDDVELGVLQGSNLIATDTLDVGLLALAVVGRLPVGTSVSVVGKVGFGSWSSRESISGQSDNDSGVQLIPSAGVEFNVSQNFDVAADVLFLNIEPTHFSNKSTLDTQLWSLGIKYSF